MTARADDEILTAITFDAPERRLRLREAEAQDRRLRDRRLRRARHHVGRPLHPRLRRHDEPCRHADLVRGRGRRARWHHLRQGRDRRGRRAATADIDPTEDNRGPVAFKMHVAGVIIRRAIARAISRA
jgi:aerobic carbon-monoxide dehydrogenase medium subunit